MKSKIYVGHVQHSRMKPKNNSFKYGLFMMYIDLDELPTLFERFFFWSKDKANLASFKSENYLCDKDHDIKNGVRNLIKEQLEVTHVGPIRMLTHLSYFGYCFNPVTFYYCFDECGENVEFVVSQINNTPWNERYSYVIDNRLGSKLPNGKNKKSSPIESHFDKKFHVSPFLPMDMQYFWRFSSPAEKLSVYMKNTQQREKVFDVTLLLKAKPITSMTLAKALIRFPLMTWQVVFNIYWQSLVLWLKKIPFHDNPTTSNQQK
jgi:DUF1365 family protein